MEELNDWLKGLNNSNLNLSALISHPLDQLLNDNCKTLDGWELVFLIQREELIYLDISWVSLSFRRALIAANGYYINNLLFYRFLRRRYYRLSLIWDNLLILIRTIVYLRIPCYRVHLLLKFCLSSSTFLKCFGFLTLAWWRYQSMFCSCANWRWRLYLFSIGLYCSLVHHRLCWNIWLAKRLSLVVKIMLLLLCYLSLLSRFLSIWFKFISH